MLEINGSTGEGGGQILRTALSVSCVTGKPVRVFNIRKGRDVSGLRPQHLTVCRLLAEISGGTVRGAQIGSQEVVFEPQKAEGGKFSFDIGTAGSCTLLLQAALPVLLSAESESELEITGGTHVSGAPTFEYFSEVFIPAARKFGAECSARVVRHGFYPKGGGTVVLRAKPSALGGIRLEARASGKTKYSIVSSAIPQHVAQREESEMRRMLAGRELEGRLENAEASCAGNAITVWRGMIGASALGERGKSSERVAGEACAAFLSEEKAGAAVDSHLADQILAYACLSEGKTCYDAARLTNHFQTNAEVLRKLTGRNIIVANDREVSVG